MLYLWSVLECYQYSLWRYIKLVNLNLNLCYDLSGCIGSCWCMGDSKCKDSTLHIQAEQTQIQWKQPFLVSCFHDIYKIMARRICINRFWLAGGEAIILIGFPFHTCIVGVNPQSWMPINTHTDTLDRNPSEKCSELIHSICLTSMLWYQSQ